MKQQIISVKRKHINNGWPRSTRLCPIHEAILDHNFGKPVVHAFVLSYPLSMGVQLKGAKSVTRYRVPRSVQRVIRWADEEIPAVKQALKKPRPFRFRLVPL